MYGAITSFDIFYSFPETILLSSIFRAPQSVMYLSVDKVAICPIRLRVVGLRVVIESFSRSSDSISAQLAPFFVTSSEFFLRFIFFVSSC